MGEADRYYEILGLKPGATQADVKQAYKDLIRVWHPDRFSHDPILQMKAQEKLKEIIHAHNQLIALSSYNAPAGQATSGPGPQQTQSGSGSYTQPNETRAGASSPPLKTKRVRIAPGLLIWGIFSICLGILGGIYYIVPSHEASNKSLTQEPPKQVPKNVEQFLLGFTYLEDVNQLVHGFATSKDKPGDLDKERTLLNQCKESLSHCDADGLNGIYPGWGNILSQKLAPAIDFYLAGLKPNADRTDLSRGDALLADFDTWMQNNWSDLLVKLHTDYGLEIK